MNTLGSPGCSLRVSCHQVRPSRWCGSGRITTSSSTVGATSSSRLKPEGVGQRHEVVEAGAALAGLDAADRRGVDQRPLGQVADAPAELGPPLAQSGTDLLLDALLIQHEAMLSPSPPVPSPPWRHETQAGQHDVVVIGGGAAGRSAALVLGRARRSVVVVDAGQPSNQVSTGIGGFLGHDQRPPDRVLRRHTRRAGEVPHRPLARRHRRHPPPAPTPATASPAGTSSSTTGRR